MLLNQGGGSAVRQLAENFGLNEGQAGGAQNAMPTGSSAGGLTGILGQFLDSNRDGSVVDDVLGMASRLFQK
jgi:hypothetical protein